MRFSLRSSICCGVLAALSWGGCGGEPAKSGGQAGTGGQGDPGGETGEPSSARAAAAHRLWAEVRLPPAPAAPWQPAANAAAGRQSGQQWQLRRQRERRGDGRHECRVGRRHWRWWKDRRHGRNRPRRKWYGRPSATGGSGGNGSGGSGSGGSAVGGAAGGSTGTIGACGSTTLNQHPFGCKFAWGIASPSGSLASYSYLQFVSSWVDSAISAAGTFTTCAGCNW